MVLSQKLAEAFNAQVNAEMWSANLYLSMAVYFKKAGLNGFAHWMEKQASEEMEHAQEMIDYAIDRGGDVMIGQVNVVPTAWGNATEVFEHVYKHECHVSEMIDNMMNIAEEDKDHPLSDQKLCQLLEGEGCAISRRTVAKYRDELGIPSASGRKHCGKPQGGTP